jgi:hypothetical protein
MHITLMRHGKPILASRRWRAPCDMGEWIAQYDLAEIDGAGIPAASLAAACAPGKPRIAWWPLPQRVRFCSSATAS